MARHDDHFPVDLPTSPLARRRPLRWTATVIATASLFLLATNAIALDGWATELEPGPEVAKLVEATGRWRIATDRSGAGSARAALHAGWKRLQATRLPGDRTQR